MEESYFREIYNTVTNKNIPAADRKKMLKTHMKEMSQVEKRDLLSKINLQKRLASDYTDTVQCAEGQNKKYCLLEFSSIDREFDIQMMFLLMSAYVADRFRYMKFDSEEQRLGAESLVSKLFNHTSSEHLDTIYDVFMRDIAENSVREEKAGVHNPSYIPKQEVILLSSVAEVSSAHAGKIVEVDHQQYIVRNNASLVPLPSYTQYRNAHNFCMNKIEEGRFLTQHYFGRHPETELTIHVHGIFDNLPQLDEYRLSKCENIDDIAKAIPIGRTVIADNFRANRDSIIMYNPADSEIEYLLQGKQNIKRAEAKLLRDKMQKMGGDSGKVPKETMERIKKWRRAQEKLTEKSKTIRDKITGVELQNTQDEIEDTKFEIEQEINRELSEHLDDNEVIMTGFKVKAGKLREKIEYINRV